TILYVLLIIYVGVQCRPFGQRRFIRPWLDSGEVKSDDRLAGPAGNPSGKTMTGEELPDGYDADDEDSTSTSGYIPAVPTTTSAPSIADFYGAFARQIPVGGETTIIVDSLFGDQSYTYAPAAVRGFGDEIYGPYPVSSNGEKSSSWVLIASIILIVVIIILVILICIFCYGKYWTEKRTDEGNDSFCKAQTSSQSPFLAAADTKKEQKEKETVEKKDEKSNAAEQEKNPSAKSPNEEKGVAIGAESTEKLPPRGRDVKKEKKEKKKKKRDKESTRSKDVDKKTSRVPETDYVVHGAPAAMKLPTVEYSAGSSTDDESIENSSLNRQLLSKIFGKVAVKLRKPEPSK
uniref:Uncharacterized protein n=1 Tax=Romanomermis culicivorax TaxID=13658 RepID=A0A915HR08_ROMCU